MMRWLERFFAWLESWSISDAMKPDPPPDDPPPGPGTGPIPPDPPKPPADYRDEVPMSECVFYGGDPRTFALDAALVSVSASGPSRGPCRVVTEWIVPDWREYSNGVVGNDWIGVKGRDGLYHLGAWEMCRAYAHHDRQSEARAGQPPFIQAHGPVAAWLPRPGDEYVYMRTTITRGTDAPAAAKGRRARTQIVRRRWGA